MRAVLQWLGRHVNALVKPTDLQLSRVPAHDDCGVVDESATPGPWGFESHPDIKHGTIAPLATYAPWLTDAAFQRVWEVLAGSSFLDEMRAYELWALGRQARTVPGDILEVGTWRGGSAALLAAAVADSGKQVWAADTFAGVVKAGPEDTYYRGGEHADATRDDVEAAFAAAGVANARILEGVFPEDTGHLIKGPLALVHIDVDVYRSALDITNWATPRLSLGGVIVFDDFGFYGCEGVTRLGKEIEADPAFLWIHNLNGHGIAIKIQPSA